MAHHAEAAPLFARSAIALMWNGRISAPFSLQNSHKIVILRACDFFDRFAFLRRPDVFQFPPKRRHPERSASQIYRITEGLWRGVEEPVPSVAEGTPAMLVGRCSSELSGHRLTRKPKKSQPLSAAPTPIDRVPRCWAARSRRACPERSRGNPDDAHVLVLFGAFQTPKPAPGGSATVFHCDVRWLKSTFAQPYRHTYASDL